MSNLLFSSGFEGVSLAAPRNVDSSGGWQDVTGTDSVTGYSWPTKLWGGTSSIQMLTYGGNLSDVIGNSISTVTGRDGTQTKALSLDVNQIIRDGTQDPLIIMPAASSAPNEFYISEWIKLPADMSQRLGPGGWTTAVPEWKSAGDFRVVTAIEVDGNGTPYWHMSWDNNANGGLPPQKFWEGYNRSVPVPQGEWAYVEFYTRRGETDGRAMLKVNGQTVFDQTGDTIGVNGAPIDRIFVANPYSGTPMEMLVDDVQVWDGLPDSSGAAASTPAAGGAAAVGGAAASGPATPQPATATTDTLRLSLSETAWRGDARFTVAVDGKTLGPAQTVTASRANGDVQEFAYDLSLQPGAHDVAVSFLNDAYGGVGMDRNLYVEGISVNGAAASGASATLLETSTRYFSVVVAPDA